MEINFEFRKERKLGEIVQDFVNLVRLIFEHFVRTILGLAAIPLCLILVLVYFGTTKINLTTSEGWEGNREVILIAILTACILVVVSLIFYGLAIEYFVLLKNKRSTAFGTKDVWDGFKRNIRKYFVFLVVSLISLTILSIPLGLIFALLMFIPFVGNFAVGIGMAMVGVWYFCAFLFYRENYMDAHTALQQTFKAMKNKFFDYGVSSYIISFIFQGMLMMLMIVPAVIITLIAYNVVGFNDSFFDSFIGRMLSSIGVTILVLLYLVYYMFSVLVSGIIYESAKEIAYGENVYEKIEQLGKERDA